MQIEDDRIKRVGEHNSYKNLHLDKNGKRLFLGDLVHIKDSFHEYHQWTGRVENLGPGKTASVVLGMPPAERRGDNTEDEKLRSERPEELSQSMLANMLRLVEKNIP